MSVNQILNRPLFRKEALKKGHLKPIKASTGAAVSNFPLVPVGTPVGGPIQVNPRRLPSTQVIKPGWGARFKANFLGTPYGQSFWKLAGKDAINFPRQMTRNPLSTMMGQRSTLPFGTGGGISRLLGFGGIYDTIDPYVGQYIQNPLGRAAVSTGLSVLGAMNPYVRAAGVAKSLYGIGKNLIYDPAKASIAAHRATPVAERQVLPSISGEAAMEEIDVSTPKEVVEKVKLESKARPRGGGRIGFENRLAQSENKDPLENNLIDIDKVVKNNVPDFIVNQKMGSQPPGEEVLIAKKSEDITDKGGKIKVTEKEQAEDIIKSNGETSVIKEAGKITAGDGTAITDDTIQRAREIRDELMAGKSSQAKLVFMANLASGLLSGTTAKGGIGGALEVFGKALGPAVNNYATIKLKEDEISNDFMQSALELAADEIAAKNDALDYEYPDRTPGIIQEIGPGGVIRNYVGAIMKDATMLIRIPGAIDQNGRQMYMPYTGTGRFKAMDFVNDTTTEIANDIDHILRSVSTADKSLRILEEAYKKDKSFGGLVGQLRITTERVTDALGDLTSFGDRVDFGDQFELLLDKNAKALVEGGEFKDEESAREYLKKEFGEIDAKGKAITGDGKSFVDKNLSKFLGDDRTSDAQNLERLAVNETILVYALANALKSKDRLTQKDIQNAKELVKVFSIGRGTKTTIRSLRALREILVDKYKSQERLYRLAGGDEGTLDNFKEAYKIIPGTSTVEQGRVFGDLSQSDLLNQFGDISE